MILLVCRHTSVAFIVLDDQSALNPLKTGLRDLVNPITELAFNRRNEPKKTTEGEWEAKYHDLEAKYAKLDAEYQRTKRSRIRSRRSRRCSNLQQTEPDVTLLPARVISVDPTGVNKIIVINRGSDDGVTVGMAVTDPNYYVGVVVKVEDTSAQVLLAIDSTHTVGVELESSHATGVAYGMWQQGGRMEIRYVDRDVQIKPEEKVITTCAPDIRTANMPCGLIIGKASRATADR